MQEKTIMKRINDNKLTASRLMRLLGSMPSVTKTFTNCKTDLEKRYFYLQHRPASGVVWNRNFEERYVGKIGGRLVGVNVKKGFKTRLEAKLDATLFQVKCAEHALKARGNLPNGLQ